MNNLNRYKISAEIIENNEIVKDLSFYIYAENKTIARQRVTGILKKSYGTDIVFNIFVNDV